MVRVADALIALVALEHLWFLVLEMFLWTKPIGLKTFRQTAAQAAATRVLAMNQGLYNGFLAAGLAWSLLAPPDLAFPLKLFFLSCVVVAGVVGALTVSSRILLVQALPAAAALALVVLGASVAERANAAAERASDPRREATGGR
jgi:putative membrane protein